MRAVKLWMMLGVVVALAGCGGADNRETASGEGASDKQGTGKLPAASIAGGIIADDDDRDNMEEGPLEQIDPQEGSPEWLIREATKQRFSAPRTGDVDELRTSRKERNEKIVDLMQQAIALTHEDKSKDRLFNVAVHHLMEARLQLALLGDKENINALYEDAAALEARDPQSPAAAEGAYALASLAYSHARSATKEDPRWMQEFAGQAKHFAGDFPKEESRSLPLLFTAARSCELHGLMEEALSCYEMISKRFPKSPYAPRVTGILRRLKLPGNPAQLGGPTLEGDQVSVDDLLGNPVLVVFWSTEAKQFEEQLPQLTAVQRKHAKAGLVVLGVNLDQEPTAVQQFVVKHHINWSQVFFSEPERRGWNNPLAAFYGVLEIPAYWLIDPRGNVVSTTLTVSDLDPAISHLSQK